jgi:hypothetical protein
MSDSGYGSHDIAVAEWVVNNIARDGWSQSIQKIGNADEVAGTSYGTVTRTYLPNWKLEDYDETRISVIPSQRQPVGLSRCSLSSRVMTDLMFAKRAKPDNLNPVGDSVLELVQEIENWFRTHRKGEAGCGDVALQFNWIAAVRPEVYNLSIVDTRHLIVASMQFTTICSEVPALCG